MGPWWTRRTCRGGIRHRGRVRDRDVGAGVPPPGQAMARVPVVACCPARPRRRKRSTAPPSPASSCSRAASRAWRSPAAGPARRTKDALLLLVGLVAVIVGILLLAPLAVSVLEPGRARGCRSRSGSRCATCSLPSPAGPCSPPPRSRCSWPWRRLVASIQFGNPLNWFLREPVQQPADFLLAGEPGAGLMTQLGSNAQLASLGRQVGLRAGLHAPAACCRWRRLASSLYQAGTQGPRDAFNGSIYVATRNCSPPTASRPARMPDRSRGHPFHALRRAWPAWPHTELTCGAA